MKLHIEFNLLTLFQLLRISVQQHIRPSLDLTRDRYFPSNLFRSEEGRYRLDHFTR